MRALLHSAALSAFSLPLHLIVFTDSLKEEVRDLVEDLNRSPLIRVNVTVDIREPTYPDLKVKTKHNASTNSIIVIVELLLLL